MRRRRFFQVLAVAATVPLSSKALGRLHSQGNPVKRNAKLIEQLLAADSFEIFGRAHSHRIQSSIVDLPEVVDA